MAELSEYKRCNVCKKSEKDLTFKMKSCVCGDAYYCCKECQRSDWSYHRAVCKSRRGLELNEKDKATILKTPQEWIDRLPAQVRKCVLWVLSHFFLRVQTDYQRFACDCMNEFELYMLEAMDKGMCCRKGCPNKIHDGPQPLQHWQYWCKHTTTQFFPENYCRASCRAKNMKNMKAVPLKTKA